MENYLLLLPFCLLIRQVCTDRLTPGDTHQFDHHGDKYWVKIDKWDSTTYNDAVSDCRNLYNASVVTISNDEQYQVIEKQVEGAIPATWREVVLWTADNNETAGTYVLLVIYRSGTGGPNRKQYEPPTYGGHGYICRKNIAPLLQSEKENYIWIIGVVIGVILLVGLIFVAFFIIARTRKPNNDDRGAREENRPDHEIPAQQFQVEDNDDGYVNPAIENGNIVYEIPAEHFQVEDNDDGYLNPEVLHDGNGNAESQYYTIPAPPTADCEDTT